MLDRRAMEHELDRIELAIREIDTAYEKYFMGVDKRPPEKDRDELHKALRRMSNRHIPQVDLRFRFQNLSTRFHSYAGNWDRTMRLIEEGKFQRQKKSSYAAEKTSASGNGTLSTPTVSEADYIYEQLKQASGSGTVSLPDRQQLAAFLDKQRAALREKTGGRDIEFVVAIEDGKPKIKARPK